VNPAVSVAFWVLGDVSLLGLAAKLLGQIAAGSLAFPLLRFLLPPYVQLGGKRDGNAIRCACMPACETCVMRLAACVPVTCWSGPSLAPGLQVVDGALIEGTLAAVMLFAIFVTSTYIGPS
jgi:glycerol uptake facilitator-like aquaporin